MTALDFGVSRALAPAVAVCIPALELAVASALLVHPWARWGAIGALVLLTGFSGVIVVNLRQGKSPDCHCFGQLGGGPIGMSTLVRNGALGAAGALILAAGWSDSGLSVDRAVRGVALAEWVGIAAASLVLAALMLLTSLVLGIVAQQGRLLKRMEELETRLGPQSPQMLGLPVGSEAPAFVLPGLDGRLRSLSDLLSAGYPLLLIFSDAACGPCAALIPEVARWQQQYEQLTLAVVSRGSLEEHRADGSALEVRDLLVEPERDVAEAYRSPGTPTAVVVSPDGMIATEMVAGGPAIAALLARASAQLTPGQPSFKGLPGSNGHPVTNDDRLTVIPPRARSVS